MYSKLCWIFLFIFHYNYYAQATEEPQPITKTSTISSKTLLVDGADFRKIFNFANRQQALTQRIAKIYLALNQNLYKPEFYQERDAAIQQFQTQLDELKLHTPTNRIKTQVYHVQKLWQDYKAIADWSINQEGATQLLALSDEILLATQELLDAYNTYAQELIAKAYHKRTLQVFINLVKETGTQRMLSQRITLLHLARIQNIDPTNTHRKLLAAFEAYELSFDRLENGKMDYAPIQTLIKTMRQDWEDFKYMISQKNCSLEQCTNEMLDQLLTISEQLSSKADQASILYQDLGAKLSISKHINAASYQNMLTQRMAKAYVALSHGYLASKHKREILESIDLFEDLMKSMTSSTKNQPIKDAQAVVATIWRNYKIMLINWEEMDDTKVIKVLEKGYMMMAACDQVTQEIKIFAQTIPAYQDFFKEADGSLVAPQHNIAHQIHQAGLQRMYSQRIAVYGLMNLLNVDTRLSKDRMQEITTAYKAIYKEMRHSKINTPAINEQLDQLAKNWVLIEQYCKNGEVADIPTILKQSDVLLDQLNFINLLYERQMDQLLMLK